MKKRSLSILTIFIICISCFLPTNVFASGNTAFSVGTNYDYIVNTSSDAKKACDSYALAGYSSYYSTQPTIDILKGTFKNGTKRMQSDILFFSGHGNNECMAFNYLEKNGKYKTGVYYKGDYNSSSGYQYVGINNNMSHVKLVTYAGCETASNNYNNITYASTNQGATCAVGWTTNVGASSHSNWLERYNDKLASGESVISAVGYANSFTYLDNNVKNARIAGKLNLTIKNSKSKSITTYKEKLKYIPLSENINVINNDEIDTTSISKIIREYNYNYDERNFKIEIHKITDKWDFTIDFIETFNGIETNSGYTAIINDGNLESIADNYQNTLNTQSISPYTKIPVLSKDTLNRIFKTAQNKALEIGAGEIINQTEKYYYDYNTKTLKLIVYTEYYFDNTKTKGVLEYEEIIS